MADSDGDGINDGDEIKKYKTDPNNADTDGDSIPDGIEIEDRTDPKDKKVFDIQLFFSVQKVFHEE